MIRIFVHKAVNHINLLQSQLHWVKVLWSTWNIGWPELSIESQMSITASWEWHLTWQVWYMCHFTCAPTMPFFNRCKSVCDHTLCDHGSCWRRSSEKWKSCSWLCKNFRMFHGKSLCLHEENRNNLHKSSLNTASSHLKFTA